ncbi:MAG: tetratricopeptide repeat protein [Smithellaceae bacterium]
MISNNKINNRSIACVSLILVVLILSAYWPVKNFDFVDYDDDKFVTQNSHVTTGLKLDNIKWAFTSAHADNWMPLTWLSFMLDAGVSNMNPAYFHMSNLLLHILNTILLFMVLGRMTGSLWKSAFVSVLFAVHPLHVESVAWITERKDVLSTFFMMLTIWAYVQYVKNPDYKRYALTFVLFACGLMSKPMLVTLPFVLLLLDYWPLRRFSILFAEEKRNNKSAAQLFVSVVYEKIPLFLLSAAVVIITIAAQKQEIIIRQVIPIYLRIENAFISYCHYILMTVWPGSLAVLYPYPEVIPLWQISAAVGALILISGLALYKARQFPYFIVGWLWYLGTLVPVIGFIQVGVQSMADRYTYIPLIGLFIVIVWGFYDLTSRLAYKKYIRASVSVIVVALLLIVALSQVKYWKDSKALFNRAIAVTNNNYVMHCNMGVLLTKQGNIQDALLHYDAALKIKPNDADTNYNYANLLAMQGKLDEAVGHYIVAIKSSPALAPAHNNLGIAYARSANQEKAIEQFREAIKLDPDYVEAKNNLKTALAQREEIKKLQANNNPDNKVIINTVQGQTKAGTDLLKKGDLDGAINHFKEVLKLDPNNLNAHISIGLALGYKQNFAEAATHFRRAIEISPKTYEAYNSLAVALAYTGKIDEAIVALKKAIEINPKFVKAYNTLGVIMAKTGKVDEGISYLREALRLDPNYAEAKKNLDLLLSMKEKQ